MEKKIIMIAGVMGSGKDHYASWYQENYEYNQDRAIERCLVVRFAEPIRWLCGKMQGIDLADNDLYNIWKAKGENRMNMVNLGQGCKEIFGVDVWAKAVRRKIEQNWLDYDTFLIPDFRFPIEYDTLLDIFKTDIFVYLTDYRSSRYCDHSPQNTEEMAQWLLKNDVPKNQLIGINEYITINEKLKRVIC